MQILKLNELENLNKQEFKFKKIRFKLPSVKISGYYLF